jgi:Fe2+ or Zn2+ uptake regulation protein
VLEIEMCIAHQFESHVEKRLEATITKHIIQLEGICKECLSDSAPRRRKR